MKDVITAEQLNIIRELTTILSDIYVEHALRWDLLDATPKNLNALRTSGKRLQSLYSELKERKKKLKKPSPTVDRFKTDDNYCGGVMSIDDW